MNNAIRRFHPDFPKVLFCVLCYCFAQNILNGVMALHLTSLGHGAVVAGYMAVAFAIFAIIARLVAGFLSDVVSRRVVLAVGCFIFALFSLLFNFIPIIGLMIFFRGLQGAGFSSSNTSASAIFVDLAPPGKLERNMSFLWGSNAVMVGIVGFFIQFLIRSDRLGDAFTMVAVAMFAACVVSLFVRYEKGLTHGKDNTPTETNPLPAPRGISRIIEKKALPAFIVLLFLSIAHAAPGLYILVYAERMGHTGMAIPYSLTAAGAMILGNIFCPSITKKWGYQMPLILVSLLNFAAMAVIAYTGTPIAFYLMAASFGILLSICMPILNTLAVKDLPFHRRGTGSGTVLLALDLGVGVGGFLFGALIDQMGFPTMFAIASTFCLGAVILTLALFRKQTSPAVAV